MKILCFILLLSFGENLFAVGLILNQPMSHLSERLRRDSALIRASIIGEIDEVRDLREQGGDINARGNNGITPLIGATEKGHENIVKYLLEQKCDVDACTIQDKFTALLLASLKNHGNIAKLLVDHGADVNWENTQGHSSLIFAVNNNNPSLVRSLVLNGANICHESRDGSTPISVALNCYKTANGPDKASRRKMIDLLINLFEGTFIR